MQRHNQQLKSVLVTPGRASPALGLTQRQGDTQMNNRGAEPRGYDDDVTATLMHASNNTHFCRSYDAVDGAMLIIDCVRAPAPRDH